MTVSHVTTTRDRPGPLVPVARGASIARRELVSPSLRTIVDGDRIGAGLARQLGLRDTARLARGTPHLEAGR